MDYKRGKFNTFGGVAAGMEADDSGDEFMFGDDDFDSDTETFQAKLPKSKASEEKIEPKVQRRAPWANDVRTKSAAVQKSYKESDPTEIHNVERTSRPLVLRLEDEEIRAAVSNGHMKYIQDAIESGFDVNTKLKSGWTCLMYASAAGNFEILKLLIDKGANVNFQKDLFTPLMALCSTTATDESRVNCAQYLVSAGGRVDAHDRHLMTPLMYAAQMGEHEILQLFIDEQADVNAQDNRGWTALAFAANAGHASSVKILLQNKALNSLSAYDGQSPADLAYSKGFTALADFLEGSKAEMDDMKLPSSSRPKTKGAHSRYKKLDELEMFLHGLDLGNLVEIFQQNQITFQDFLKISEDDLIKIGVGQLGARKKILDAVRGVHTNEWDLSGLTVDRQSKISTIEAGAIAANIAKHLDFIRSSVSFLQNYVKTCKETITKDEPSTQKILVDQCRCAYSNSCQLQSDLNQLQSLVATELRLESINQCDFIDGSKARANKTRRRRLFLPFVGCLTILGIAVYRCYYR